MMKWIEEQGSVNPQALNLWKFVPEEFVAPAIERDRKILFGE
jgi:2',3'-cyclic-nucleotide 2'-phosphodiesterase/3'-nucleotidase